VTLVCHLLVAPAVEGRVVGRVDVVATGDSVSVNGVDELLALVQDQAEPDD
jgi:hypothetical protein